MNILSESASTHGYKSRSLLVFYHYLFPDEVVSSVVFTELSTELARLGWHVQGVSGNRSHRDVNVSFPKSVSSGEVVFRHLWRPRLTQNSSFGRLMNAVWMLARWSLLALTWRGHTDIVLVGTDPILSPLISFPWRLFRPRTRLAHWCFDLYPEAAVEDGLLDRDSSLVRVLVRILEAAYRRFDLMVDIGSCMRARISRYKPTSRLCTITPWALYEPPDFAEPDASERHALFGEAPLGLLYSGSFGRAHSAELLPDLALAIEPRGGRLAFSVGGHAVGQLEKAFQNCTAPVTFAPLCPPSQLQRRLSAADVHIVSLKENWTGTVVPSKFFGALAIGRPVLFVGSRDSAIARWIHELKVGWVLDKESFQSVFCELGELAASPARKQTLFSHCFSIYRQNFSRESSVRRWDTELRALVNNSGQFLD